MAQLTAGMNKLYPPRLRLPREHRERGEIQYEHTYYEDEEINR